MVLAVQATLCSSMQHCLLGSLGETSLAIAEGDHAGRKRLGKYSLEAAQAFQWRFEVCLSQMRRARFPDDATSISHLL